MEKLKNKMASESREETEREKKHKELSTMIASQGIVLLKNENVLPFNNRDTKELALFGNGARRTIRGGTGSGDVNVRSYTNLEEGLIHAGYKIVTKDVLDEYDQIYNTAQQKVFKKTEWRFKVNKMWGLVYAMMHRFEQPVFQTITKEMCDEHPADAAVYVLSRVSGEGGDRGAKQGDYYLTDSEINDLKILGDKYKKVVLLLNVGGVVDLSKVKNMKKIGAIVLIGQGGSGAGDAAAMVLSGKVNPSGKLTATWASDYKDYPNAEEFATVSKEEYDTEYKEDIFVGYRYFDSFNVKPLYPFGFGLSYTDFDIQTLDYEQKKNIICISVKVTNIGNVSGKEVIQAYVSKNIPNVINAYQELVAFSKTKELKPGESQVISLSFGIEEFQYYSEEKESFIIGEGSYVLRVGNSSVNTEAICEYLVSNDVVVEKCKNLLRGHSFEQMIPVKKSEENNLQKIFLKTDGINCKTHQYKDIHKLEKKQIVQRYEEVLEDQQRAESFIAGMPDEDLIKLVVGGSRNKLGKTVLVGNASKSIPGAAGETTDLLGDKYGIPSITVVDGPAGIRVNSRLYEKDNMYVLNYLDDFACFHFIPEKIADSVKMPDCTMKYQYCTAIPVATVIAQTFDVEMMRLAGEIVGYEMQEMGVSLWLAPALNIQRNPLCGRNFEYFSEDPLLSGICASEVTKGVHKIPGKSTTIKHFAANNQETNRLYNNSVVSERALREIYLKGFRYCIEESEPLSIMTSCNLINGEHTASDYSLLTNILRDEWGFDGLVMTDWGVAATPHKVKKQKYDCAYIERCIYAGNDLIMPGTQEDIDLLTSHIKDGSLERKYLENCALNILKVLIRTYSREKQDEKEEDQYSEVKRDVSV